VRARACSKFITFFVHLKLIIFAVFIIQSL